MPGAPARWPGWGELESPERMPPVTWSLMEAFLLGGAYPPLSASWRSLGLVADMTTNWMTRTQV